MDESRNPFLQSNIIESANSYSSRFNPDKRGRQNFIEPGFPGLKKRGHALGNRSWIKIEQNGSSKVVELDKATVMRHCSLPARDLRLLDPLFIYPSTILGREKAIVVSLEQIRCIITADEVFLMNSLDGSVVQYKSELCKRHQQEKYHSDDLPFEFRALELALEFTCLTLDTQVKELEMEIHPVLDTTTTTTRYSIPTQVGLRGRYDVGRPYPYTKVGRLLPDPRGGRDLRPKDEKIGLIHRSGR